MAVVLGILLIALYVYLVKFRKGGTDMPWWVHISMLLTASSVLVTSVIGAGLIGMVNACVGFLAGVTGGGLELIADQPVEIPVAYMAGGAGIFFLIVLLVDVWDKIANKPALVAAVLIPLLAFSATGGFLGDQGKDFVNSVSEASEGAGRAIVGG